jgi:hypothetical protein
MQETGHKAFQCQSKPKGGGCNSNANKQVIVKEMERSFKESAVYVASKATRKRTAGIMTRTQARDPRITKRVSVRAKLAMSSWCCVVCVRKTKKLL